jgi:hypothetical protein
MFESSNSEAKKIKEQISKLNTKDKIYTKKSFRYFKNTIQNKSRRQIHYS